MFLSFPYYRYIYVYNNKKTIRNIKKTNKYNKQINHTRHKHIQKIYMLIRQHRIQT